VPRTPKGKTNPFRYGDVVTGSLFTNRQDELAALETDIRSGQNVVLLSPRRFGKTSLVTEAIAHLRSEDVLVAYVDLLRATTKTELAGALATALYHGLVSPFEQAIHRLSEVFGDLPLTPKLTFPTNQQGTVTPTFEFGVSSTTEDADATLQQLLAMPADVAAKRKRRVALVLDEFQAILDIDPTLPRRMRAVFQFQADVSHVYLGSKQHLLHKVFTDVNEPLYNSARVLPVGPISADRFRPFIHERFLSTGLTIKPNAIDRLLEVTHGHPHDTQKLAYFIWNLAQAGAHDATVVDVEMALRQVLTTDTARYTEIWESLTPYRRQVLELVARHGRREDLLSARFREVHGLKSYAAVADALERLVERSLIERIDREHYEVPDVFMALWLRDAAN
jgi:uncharacterized protein